MSTLLRSDFYRLFKSKSLYICAAVSMFFIFTNILLLDWANRVMEKENPGGVTLDFKDGISYGMSAFSNSNVIMIVSIFTAIFIASEFAHGTMKNVVSKGFSKMNIFFSKFISMSVAAYIIIIATFITGTVSAAVILGSVGDVTGRILSNAGVELLLNTALVAVFVFVAMVIRNLGGVIAVNVIGVLSFSELIFTALESLIKSKINFHDFSLLDNIMYYYQNNTATGSDFLRSSIVALVYLGIAIICGVFIFKKSDVK